MAIGAPPGKMRGAWHWGQCGPKWWGKGAFPPPDPTARARGCTSARFAGRPPVCVTPLRCVPCCSGASRNAAFSARICVQLLRRCQQAEHYGTIAGGISCPQASLRQYAVPRAQRRPGFRPRQLHPQPAQPALTHRRCLYGLDAQRHDHAHCGRGPRSGADHVTAPALTLRKRKRRSGRVTKRGGFSKRVS
jgi:hypothetical protein